MLTRGQGSGSYRHRLCCYVTAPVAGALQLLPQDLLPALLPHALCASFLLFVISASCYIYVVCWSLLSALLTGEGEGGMNDLLQLSPHGLVLNSLPAVTRTSWSCRHSVIMHRQISFSTSFWNGSSTSAAGKCKST